jgi:hypothetical protein
VVVVVAVWIAISMLFAPLAASEVLHSTVVPVPIAPLVIFGHGTTVPVSRIESAVYVTAKMIMTVVPRSRTDENSV